MMRRGRHLLSSCLTAGASAAGGKVPRTTTCTSQKMMLKHPASASWLPEAASLSSSVNLSGGQGLVGSLVP